MDKNLLVEIFVGVGKENGYIATGYPVGNNRIITACHVLYPDGQQPISIEVRWYHQTDKAREWQSLDPQKCIVWEDHDTFDVALLDCKFPVTGNAQLSAKKPQDGADWASEGFPDAGKIDDNQREPVSMGGTTYSAADTMSRFELGINNPPEEGKLWKGASGSPVFVDGRIIGIIASFQKPFGGKRFKATPTWKLLAIPDFCAAVGYDAERAERLSDIEYALWSTDVQKLKDHGTYILNKIRKTIGEIHIDRLEIDQLVNLTESSHFILVSGEQGTGKSSLVKTFSEHLAENTPLFCLRAEDLDESHLDKVFSAIGLKRSLSDLEAGFASMPKKYLIVESLEKVLELKNTAAFTDLLHFLNKQSGWTMIATVRNYAYQAISFNYLQPNEVQFKTLILNSFSDDQVQNLCNQLEILQKLSGNPTLESLLKFPFLAELAYRVLKTGTEFTPQDGEKEFRSAVWKDVIAKEQERTNGMPLKRKQTFINIAVKRAKKMVYGIPVKSFDSEAVCKLEEDNLIHCKENLVSPAHDVLEDWAIEEYIEGCYQEHADDIREFLQVIGQEPAMNRAFRLWLHRRLREGDEVNDLIDSILDNKTIQRCWQDEAIAAIFLGDNPDEFLKSLREKLFLNNGELLKRFCFILRIACQIPDEERASPLKDNGLYLKPYGRGWPALISFLLHNKEHLSESLSPYVIAVLDDWVDDWVKLLHIDKEPPPATREAGLLALYLLEPLKHSSENRKDRKILLTVIIRTISAISEEFIKLLETDVFITQDRLYYVNGYVNEFSEMLFSRFETDFLCKNHPDILIKLADFEWFIQKSKENDPLSDLKIAKFFGLRDKYNFFPASGEKGPFLNLLRYHPKKGLDFILGLLNKASDYYAHSNKETPVKQIEIQLDDGSIVKQYCSEDLWLAYRGLSNFPHLFQCALMALENWLIDIVGAFNSDKALKWPFDYILRNSNSVLPTAVLASVATGFHQKVGRFALPLLRIPELYLMDLHRSFIHEGNVRYNFTSDDPLCELYRQERQTAALRPWRKEYLEKLVVQLQFSEWRKEALAAIDAMYASAISNDETIRFLFHRIDSRGWNLVDPDLKAIQQKTQEQQHMEARFMELSLWAKDTIAHEPPKRNYYETWDKALSEAKALFKEIESETASGLATMYYGGIVTATAIFIRDHSHELTEEEVSWCTKLIIETVIRNADSNDSFIIGDQLGHDGAVSAASVLPVLLDVVSEDKRFQIKHLIAIALTHVNENVRHSAAEGIRQHLWQRDDKFAQSCIIGAIAYARFEQNNRFEKRQLSYFEDKLKKDAQIKIQKENFRGQFAQSQFSINDLDKITLQTYDPRHLLAPCLMIPDGSKKPEHVSLLSQILMLCFESEQNKHRSNGDKLLEIPDDTVLKFTKRFATYLFYSHESTFQDYIEKLKVGCNVAPYFMYVLILHIAVKSEQTGRKEIYWKFWEALSQEVQKIAIKMIQSDYNDQQHNDKHRLIRCMLADHDYQKIDIENPDMLAYGKDLILEFVRKAGRNAIVFGALAKLIYYFPSIFFESGLLILSEIQNKEGGTRLLSKNTAFYLEIAIQRFLQSEVLSKKMHESCFILLNGIVETASSRGYFLRERLIQTRKIL